MIANSERLGTAPNLTTELAGFNELAGAAVLSLLAAVPNFNPPCLTSTDDATGGGGLSECKTVSVGVLPAKPRSSTSDSDISGQEVNITVWNNTVFRRSVSRDRYLTAIRMRPRARDRLEDASLISLATLLWRKERNEVERPAKGSIVREACAATAHSASNTGIKAPFNAQQRPSSKVIP
jgi:hypothetical protein